MKRESKKAGRKERRSKIKKIGWIKGRKAKIKVRGRKRTKILRTRMKRMQERGESCKKKDWPYSDVI